MIDKRNRKPPTTVIPQKIEPILIINNGAITKNATEKTLNLNKNATSLPKAAIVFNKKQISKVDLN